MTTDALVNSDWMITRRKKANNFQIAKVQSQSVVSLRVLLSFCLIFFCQFQPGVTSESVAYIKKRVTDFP